MSSAENRNPPARLLFSFAMLASRWPALCTARSPPAGWREVRHGVALYLHPPGSLIASPVVRLHADIAGDFTMRREFFLRLAAAGVLAAMLPGAAPAQQNFLSPEQRSADFSAFCD